MKTPPNRIAAIALVLLVLAGAGGWWWHHGPKPERVASMQAQEASPAPGLARANVAAGDASGLFADAARMDAAFKQCSEDMALLHRRRWEELGAKDDLESRLAHAVMANALGEGVQHPSTSALLEAVAAEAPDDAEVAWYRASRCPKDSDCDHEQAIGRLLELEPGNLDAWLMALAMASQRGQDEASLQALLERAAKASYYDPRTGETFTRFYQAMQGLPLPKSCRTPEVEKTWAVFAKLQGGITADDMAIIAAMAASSAETKAHAPIMKLCRVQEAPLEPRRAAACRPILAKLADGDGLLDQMMGIDAMLRLSAGTPENERWRERYRNLQWMLANEFHDIRYDRDEVVRRMTDGDMRAGEQALRAQGRWPAPEGWLPADEHARSLVLTGRPPPESGR